MNVSVIVTCFNYERFIVEALESALAQSHPPFEIIVMNDGSTDRSAELVQEHFGSEARVKLVTTPNQGQLAAFYEGLEHATGEVVALLDADDRWSSGYLQRVVQCLAKNPTVDFVMTNLQFFGSRQGRWREPAGDIDHGITSAFMSLTDSTPHWLGVATSGLALRRRHMEALRMPAEFFPAWRTCADVCLIWGSSIVGGHKYFINDTLVDYRVHENNNWHAGGWSPVAGFKDQVRRQRLLNFFREKAFGSARPHVSLLHFEFKSRPRPTLKSLVAYLRMIPRTDGGLGASLQAALSLSKHYLRGPASWPMERVAEFRQEGGWANIFARKAAMRATGSTAERFR
ncbi:MAG: glycosyltransferase family 2 protein [Ramlibacter sp.]|nr:glycosyltransferase family 2 protein [Ramlibacter sp.]